MMPATHHETADVRRRRAEGKANRDLAGALGNEVGEHPVDAHRRHVNATTPNRIISHTPAASGPSASSTISLSRRTRCTAEPGAQSAIARRAGSARLLALPSERRTTLKFRNRPSGKIAAGPRDGDRDTSCAG